MKLKYTLIPAVSSLCIMMAACQNGQVDQQQPGRVLSGGADDNVQRDVVLTPQAIPGTPKAENNNVTGGYAPTHVQAQLKIDVKDGTKQVRVIRDNTDPFVITKPYLIRNADPYAVRSYLEAAVGARSVSASPAQVSAVVFKNDPDAKGVVLVSAEEYRFSDSDEGLGIDKIVASLDKKGLSYTSNATTRIYFPRLSRASNLRDMLIKVGSSELDPQFEISPSTLLVDGELNALLINAPEWAWDDMRTLLKKYDKPIPEVRVNYEVIEIYAENDDRIGVDFQSWKNNEGVDLFSAGAHVSRNWGTFFTSGPQNTGMNKTTYWNFNPKWNTRYLDFMTSIGKAKVLAKGTLLAQNRITSKMQINSGFFYDRTYYTAGATSIAEACTEFTYTDPNPDTIPREAYTKILSQNKLVELYNDLAPNSKVPWSTRLVQSGYTMRQMGTQTGTNTFADAAEVIEKNTGLTLSDKQLAKFLTGFIKLNSDGSKKVVNGTYYNTDGDYMNAAPGIIHGWLQYPMVTDGFKFDLRITPVITGKAAKLKFELDSISLLGWNSDGSARTSKSNTSANVQIGYDRKEFVIGGLKKSESVRSTAGLPFFKDIPVLGRAFSTESESIKQSQLVVIATVEIANPDDSVGAEVKENIGKVIKGVNKGMKSRVGNMFFQQRWLDEDREDRIERLDSVGNIYNDNYQEKR